MHTGVSAGGRQLRQARVECRDRLFEHTPVCKNSGPVEVMLRPCSRQLEHAASFFDRALFLSLIHI